MAPPDMEEISWCSEICFGLVLIGIVLVTLPFALPIGIVLVILRPIWMVSGWLQFRLLTRHLRRLETKRAHDELHSLPAPSSMKYGPWQGKASALLKDQKELIKSNSLQLGISLRFALEELEPLYMEKAEEAEWRFYYSGSTTRSCFFAQLLGAQCRSRFLAWKNLEVCGPPENPDFHQVAGLLAYGPHALGKGQICPRDGCPDCSVVDALFDHNKSAKANWFLSWLWGYRLYTVLRALKEWRRRFCEKTGSGEGSDQKIYLWWDLFVNNQFRFLEDGQIQEPEEIVACFCNQLVGIGKMIMCMDKLHGSQYTCRIYTIFDVYLAIQSDIKITLAIPPDALDIDDICGRVCSLPSILAFCRVDSEKADADVRGEAYYIHDRIRYEVGYEHLNEIVEDVLVSEILQLLKSHNKASDFPISEVYQEEEADSRYFGVSLDFVLSEFKRLYLHKAPEAEWRLHDQCEVTESGFTVKVRDCCDVESGIVAWDELDVCRPPENPNFYQLAGLLAYGPHALGKGIICTRDRCEDCSLVDALRWLKKSDNANWFLSWAWSYSLDVVCNALARWWDSHAAVVASEACPSSVYLWWCFFVNNQFRMLEDGVTLDTDSLLEVFAEPLQRAGKVLMCMDNFRNCTYTKRIWCIYEIFSALRRNIPVTLVMPQLELEQEVETLTEMVHACRVDASQARASVKADEEKIKTKILQDLKSFEKVIETVEKALCIKMIKMFKARKDKASFRHSSSVLLDQQQIACVVSL